jgi:hypothetical protein
MKNSKNKQSADPKHCTAVQRHDLTRCSRGRLTQVVTNCKVHTQKYTLPHPRLQPVAPDP